MNGTTLASSQRLTWTVNTMHAAAAEFPLDILQTVHSFKSITSLSKLKKFALTQRLVTRLSLSPTSQWKLTLKRGTITIPLKQDVSSIIPSTHFYTGQDATSRILKSTLTCVMSPNHHHGHKSVHTAGSMDTRSSIAMHMTRWLKPRKLNRKLTYPRSTTIGLHLLQTQWPSQRKMLQETNGWVPDGQRYP